MTIRQLWVRLTAILGDSSSPLVHAIRAHEAESEELEQVAGIDDALAMITRGA